jgi:hypothetical protein
MPCEFAAMSANILRPVRETARAVRSQQFQFEWPCFSHYETIVLIPRYKMAAPVSRVWPMSTDAHHDLIFSHDGNARASASVVLIGVVAALIGSVFMAIGPRFKQEPRPTRDASAGVAPALVRIIGHVPADTGSCDQYVWPNINRRCLVRTDGSASSGETSSPARDSKLSSAAATGATSDNQPAPQNVTEGSTPFRTATPAMPRQEALDDDEEKLRAWEPVEPPRKRTRRHYRSFHFGEFRF